MSTQGKRATASSQPDNAFGKYEILEIVDSGGVAEFYKARDREKGRIVLLRVLTRSASENPDIRRIFAALQTERSRFIADDPYVLRLLEIGRCSRRYYLAFEYVEGESLARYLEKHKPDIEEALGILRQAAEGLRAFHQRRIAHGDVKPANIIVGRDAAQRMCVKLAPMDIASAATESMVSIYGELVGTPKYLSPEQIEGKPVEMRSDIFSLGIVAYELFAGRPPFQAETPLGYLRANAEKDAPPLVQVDTTIPVEVSRVVARMLARDPRRRYRSSQSLVDDLERIEARMAGDRLEVVPSGVDSAFAASEPLPQPRSWTGWRTAAVVSITVCVLLMLAVGLMLAGYVRVGPAASPKASAPAAPVAAAPSRPSVPPTETSDPLAQHYNAAVRAANEAAGEGRYDEAVGLLERFLKDHPDTRWTEDVKGRQAKFLLDQTEALAASGRFEEAVRLCGDVSARFPRTSWDLKARATAPRILQRWQKKSEKAGEWDAAIAVAERLVSDYKDSPEAAAASRALPGLYLRNADHRMTDLADHQKAVACLRAVIEKYPKTPGAREAAARLPKAILLWTAELRGAGRFEEAARVLEDLLKQTRGAAAAEAQNAHAQLLLAWARRLRANGDLSGAVRKWKELQARYPGSAAAQEKSDLAELAAVVWALRKEKGSEGARVTNSEILYAWAKDLEKADRRKEAFEIYRRLFKDYPKTAEARRAGGVLAARDYRAAEDLLARGDIEQAFTAFKRIAETYPDSAPGKAAAKQVHLRDNAPEGMVYVPGGPFTMGLPPETAEKLAAMYGLKDGFLKETVFGPQIPSRKVVVKGFYIDRCEVTNAEYKAFIEATKHAPPAASPDWKGRQVRKGLERHPVVGVTYEDAVAFAKWKGKRLPTEEEWEKAARGPGGRLFPWGDEFFPDRANIKAEKAATRPVGSYPHGASVYGCLDLCGNVMEWTASPYVPYPGNPLPKTLYNEAKRVIRGGSWQEQKPYDALATCRWGYAPLKATPAIGFRCAKDAE